MNFLSLFTLCPWMFLAFFLAFAYRKIPLFPFHTWLPDAHTEAPTISDVSAGCGLTKNGDIRIYPLCHTTFPQCGFGCGMVDLLVRSDRNYLRARGSLWCK